MFLVSHEVKMYHHGKINLGITLPNLSLLRSIRRRFETFNVMYASTYNRNMIDMEIGNVYVLLKGSPVLSGIFVTFCWSFWGTKECGRVALTADKSCDQVLWSIVGPNVWFRSRGLIQFILMIHLTDARSFSSEFLIHNDFSLRKQWKAKSITLDQH